MSRRSAAMLAALLLAACNSDPGAPSGGDVVGEWHVTSWEYSLVSDPNVHADWVDLTHLTGTLTIGAAGSFSVTPALPSGFGHDQGQLTFQGDSIYWDGENDEEWVHFTLIGSKLTLVWPEAEVIDLDHDGQPEDALLKVVLTR